MHIKVNLIPFMFPIFGGRLWGSESLCNLSMISEQGRESPVVQSQLSLDSRPPMVPSQTLQPDETHLESSGDHGHLAATIVTIYNQEGAEQVNVKLR